MYGEQKQFTVDAMPNKIVEHLNVAQRMASDIVDAFKPEEQNEMLQNIREYIKTSRQKRIASLQEELAYLEKTLSDIL